VCILEAFGMSCAPYYFSELDLVTGTNLKVCAHIEYFDYSECFMVGECKR
jgi:hypothetical protein